MSGNPWRCVPDISAETFGVASRITEVVIFAFRSRVVWYYRKLAWLAAGPLNYRRLLFDIVYVVGIRIVSVQLDPANCRRRRVSLKLLVFVGVAPYSGQSHLW